ncbi:ExbD/TolR family protein [Salegentibacter salegens]|uniref:GLPGLI family protein n=1 Tax=Salegentibacter salegens TaxID=143223 RepID=A0A1M7NCA8_9FLAO|nr:hypothetical protein [Salegentibacter salegens]PRX42957.1 hypothetical protein LY58_02646 [Salegentibacter salegens]SHN01322.1 hypothetical protein SAMN05878281_3029 [Salegentibacter salegens]
MKFKITLLFFSLFVCISAVAQDAFEINVFVDADKNIYLEDKQVKSDKLSIEVKELVNNQPALKYDGVIFNIYGDEKLKHGFIMDINREMLAGYDSGKIITKKYLLNYTDVEMDSENWQQEIKSLNLKAIEN